jgi:hypothetical protein
MTTVTNETQQNLIWFNDDMQTVTHHILKLDPEGAYGWIFEANLDYPSHLHDLHNDEPLCLDRKHVFAQPRYPSTRSTNRFEHLQAEKTWI